MVSPELSESTKMSIEIATDAIYGRVGTIDGIMFDLDIYSPNSKLWELSNRLEKITNYNLNLPSLENAGEESNYRYLIRMGTELLYAETVAQRYSLLRLKDREGLFAEGAALGAFLYAADILVTVNGVSLKDLKEYKPSGKNDSVQAVPYFTFLLDAQSSWLHQGELLMENQQFPFNEYPPLADTAISQVAWIAQALIDPPIVDLEKEISKKDGVAKQAASRARGYVGKVSEIVQDTRKILLNPNSPYFEYLKIAMERFMAPDAESGYKAFDLLFGADKELVVSAYRLATSNMAQDVESDFYYQLACNLLDHINYREITGILTMDDMQLITSEEVDPSEIEVSGFDEAEYFEGMRRRLNVVSSQTSERQFKITDLENISFGDFVTPTEVSVTLDRSKPQKITTVLRYVGDEGDALTFTLDVDTAKRKFDWNLIEDPNLKLGLKAEALIILDKIIDKIQLKAQSLAQQKKPTLVQVTPQGPTRKIPVINYQKAEKIVEKRQPIASITPLKIELSKSVSQKPEIHHVRNIINLPSDEELAKLLAGYTPYQQEDILDGIKEYNLRQIGEFKKVEKSNKETEDRYTLRISVTGIKKGVRVFMTESNSSNGIRGFNIKSIKLRSKAHKPN